MSSEEQGLAVSAVGLSRFLRQSRRLRPVRPSVFVDDLTFTVGWGSALGVAGASGSGKTTTLALLAGLVRPTGGTLEVAGVDMVKHPARARRSIGMLIGAAGVDTKLTVREQLRFYAVCQRAPRRRRAGIVDALLELVNLSERAHVLGGALSPGERRRVLLARALLADPPLLLLDDPAGDLDPEGQHELWDLLTNLRAMNKTIVMSVSRVTDIERVCTHALILVRGRACAHGTVHAVAGAHEAGLEGAVLAAAGASA